MASETTPRVRMIDIAREAGVSRAVVTKVLSGGAGNIRVSREKAELVRAIAERLDYRPNILASTLGGGSSRIVGVHIDSMAPSTYVRNLSSIEHHLTRLGYHPMIAEAHEDAGSVIENFRAFQQYGAEAVIFMCDDYTDRARETQKELRRIVRSLCVGRPQVEGIPFVEIDWGRGARLAAGHLIARGKRRLGILLSQVTHALGRRLEGFQVACAAAGVEFSGHWHLSDLDGEKSIPEAVERFVLPNRLDGLVMQNDVHAVFAMRELFKRGIRIPQEVGIVGHDNCDFCAGLYPALTSIDENNNRIGEETVRLLHAMISGREVNPTEPPVVEPSLIVREST